MYVLRKMAAPGGESFRVLEYHMSKSVVTVKRAFRAKYAKEPAYRQDHSCVV